MQKQVSQHGRGAVNGRAIIARPGSCRPRRNWVVGDVTQPETLPAVVDGVDAIVFTLGSDGLGKAGAETVDYGGVRNVLAALGRQPARIALMTAVGATNRTGAYNRSTQAHDWKRLRTARTCQRAAVHDRAAGAGSTTTARTSTGSCCARETRARPATPWTAS